MKILIDKYEYSFTKIPVAYRGICGCFFLEWLSYVLIVRAADCRCGICKKHDCVCEDLE